MSPIEIDKTNLYTCVLFFMSSQTVALSENFDNIANILIKLPLKTLFFSHLLRLAIWPIYQML